MSTVQIAFCVAYCVIALGLIAIIAAQQGQNKSPMGSLGGGSTETFYSKHIGKSKEAQKKRATIVLALAFFAMNVGAAFLFAVK